MTNLLTNPSFEDPITPDVSIPTGGWERRIDDPANPGDLDFTTLERSTDWASDGTYSLHVLAPDASGGTTFVAVAAIDPDSYTGDGDPPPSGVFPVTPGQSYTFQVDGYGGPPPVSETVTVDDPGAQVNELGDGVSLWMSGSDSLGNPLTWSVDVLPSGLSLDSSTGEISGIVSGVATTTVTVTATDTVTSATGSLTFTWDTVDNHRIAFSMYVSGPNEVATIKPNGTGLSAGASSEFGHAFGSALRPTWNPGRYELLCQSSSTLPPTFWVTDRRGFTSTQVVVPASTNRAQACWSPDGTKIAVVYDDGTNEGIAIVPIDGSPPTLVPLGASGSGAIYYSANFAGGIVWSPDGTKFAYVTGTGPSWSASGAGISVCNIDGSGVTVVLTGTPGAGDTGIDNVICDWYADNAHLLVRIGSLNTAFNGGIYKVALDGTIVTTIFAPSGSVGINGGSGSAALSPDESQVVVSTAAFDDELRICPADGSDTVGTVIYSSSSSTPNGVVDW